MPIPVIAVLSLLGIALTQLWSLGLLCLLIPFFYFGRTKKVRYWPDWYFIFCGEFAHLCGVIMFLFSRSFAGDKK
jgi:hypothetical protein